MKNNPYIGPWPFEREDRANFYGRKSEARVLGALIRSEREVLFYATSGAGKTSLLNAAVIPELEEDGFAVLPVARLGSQVPPGIDPGTVDNVFVYSMLLSLVGEDADAPALRSCRLRTFLQERISGLDSPDDRPVLLIVDQLEELFTTHHERWQDATGFFQQMREALDTLPDLGVLLVVREDHLAGVDPYAPLLPRRLQARFRMERLGVEGALAAVSGPADNAGCPFEPDAAKRLVDDLRRIKVQLPGDDCDKAVLGPYVEPVQLQVVCRRLWESLPEGKDGPIHWGEVEQYGGVDRALIGFYHSSLDHVMAHVEPLPAPGWTVTESQLRRWFGEQLITPQGTRGLAFRDEKVQETAGLPNAAVERLEDQHIIRATVRAGARWYELAHDRLIEPVQADNAAWRQAHLSPLQHQAALWEDRNRQARVLLGGRALEEAEEWASTHEEDLTAVEREFLAASQVSWQGEQERAKKRRRLVLVLIALGAVLILGVCIGSNLIHREILLQGVAGTESAYAAEVSNLERTLTAITVLPCLTCPTTCIPTSTATPAGPKCTPTVTATPTPTSTATGTPTATSTATGTPATTSTPAGAPTPTSTPTLTPTPTSSPTHTPTARGTPTSTSTYTPMPTSSPTHTPMSTSTPTYTPTPTVLPAISIADASVNELARTMTFPINLSAPSGLDVSVDYTTAGDTANPWDDYGPISDTLTIPAGNTSGQIEVEIYPDDVVEDPEVFTVDLSGAENATLKDAQGVGTILDETTSVGLAILSSTYATLDHNEPGVEGPLVFVVQAVVTNTGSFPAEALSLTLDYNEDDYWELLDSEDQHRRMRRLGIGDTFHAYWFATYTTTPSETHKYTVTAGAVNAALISEPGEVETVRAKSTGSPRPPRPPRLPPPISVGIFSTTSVSWTLGSTFNQAAFSPVGNVDYDPASLRLVTATVAFIDNDNILEPLITNRLFFESVPPEADGVQATFDFLVLRPDREGVRLRPYTCLRAEVFKYPKSYNDLDAGTVIASTVALSMTKGVNASIVQPGESLTYTISYTNTGPDRLQHIWIWDNVDPGIGSITSAFPTPAVLSAQQVAWYVRSVAPEPEGRGVFTLKIDVDGGGQVLTDGQQIVNHAFLGVDPGDVPANPALTSTITSTVHVPAVLLTETEVTEKSSFVSMRLWFLGLGVLSLWGVFWLVRKIGRGFPHGRAAPGSRGPPSCVRPDE
jgi:uncharacterized repeat protein (TIGR01451 family)